MTITNSLVTAASAILIQMQGADATLTTATATPAAGSFVVKGNANATAITKFDYVVFN